MINFEKLAQVPSISDYSHDSQFKSFVEKWENIWRNQSDIGKYHSALIRALECTNGCVQYAYRDQKPFALSIEQTRLSMKTSMGIIKNKKLSLKNGDILEFDPSIHDLIDEVRDIYIAGFKENDDDKVKEFYAQSVAQFFVLGSDCIDNAFQFVVDNFAHVFTIEFIERGKSYVYKYLDAIQPVNDQQQNDVSMCANVKLVDINV
ncbi:hypothetical protein GSN00_00545 [Cylindrospermopsis raciborskii CHAB3438]|uniref:hypothetical protein n=1 Tax=Cylindrospermopsis raciborskii TaxID=77022 RepID=UPI001F0F9E46|nr:hypothetical protein [Cylindrospermopsis raciborskii]MCH4902919.1 hypothetical protein [Cylindrospermopsis raciborskii CHAB3438]